MFEIVNFSNIIKFCGNALKAFVKQERLSNTLYRKSMAYIIVVIINFIENVFRNGVKRIKNHNKENTYIIYFK